MPLSRITNPFLRVSTSIASPAANTVAITTSSTERLRVNNSGNVGIGTNGPSVRLEVTSASAGEAVRITNGTTGQRLHLYTGNATNTSRVEAQNADLQLFAYDGGYATTFGTNNTERMRITSAGGIRVGSSTDPSASSAILSLVGAPSGGASSMQQFTYNGGTFGGSLIGSPDQGGGFHVFTFTGNVGSETYTERMRITSGGVVLVGKTASSFSTQGAQFNTDGNHYNSFTRSAGGMCDFNRLTDDGELIAFWQDTNKEGSVTVSGSTVAYNGGHLSRWSQWQNQTGKPEVYRGSVLESTNDMCEWNQANEQVTKTIVSNTAKSKAVAGVFDMYDLDDENNPYDFYVAQSGDFVIRIAQGVVVENGDLLESAGNGTARPQADDICRSSTIAKVTSNYVSTTYADGSYCVPCILMIG
jgi:hypothetical protein